jgi:serine/threonine-protein kinase
MAEVFLAARESLGGFEKPVAVKRFRKTLLESSSVSVSMFLREAKLCARLSHPNIVQIFDVGEAGGDLYMAMEYVDGRDVSAILERNVRPLPPRVVAHIGQMVADALDCAHNTRDLSGEQLGIVHRDVSVYNVMVSFDGWVKLIDFGIAIAGKELAAPQQRVAGNVPYMSPEQCSGRPIDGRSDLFSLGVVLHELLSGKTLFRRESVQRTLGALLTAPIPPLDDAPAPLARAVLRALERDVPKRWQSAAEMREALRSASAELGAPVDAHELSRFMQELFPRRTDEERRVSFAQTEMATPAPSDDPFQRTQGQLAPAEPPVSAPAPLATPAGPKTATDEPPARALPRRWALAAAATIGALLTGGILWALLLR